MMIGGKEDANQKRAHIYRISTTGMKSKEFFSFEKIQANNDSILCQLFNSKLPWWILRKIDTSLYIHVPQLRAPFWFFFTFLLGLGEVVNPLGFSITSLWRRWRRVPTSLRNVRRTTFFFFVNYFRIGNSYNIGAEATLYVCIPGTRVPGVEVYQQQSYYFFFLLTISGLGTRTV